MAAYGCRNGFTFLKKFNEFGPQQTSSWKQGEIFRSRFFSTGRTVRNQQQHEEKTNGEENASQRRAVKLMNFPYIAFPNFWHSIKNWILVKLIVRPYFDHEFTTVDFMKGAEQAVSYVSSQLAVGNFEPLEGLVTSEALSEVKKNYSLLDVKQRHNITVSKDDVYFSFPYQIGIMFEDTPAAQKRYVEITTCFHYFLGFKDFQTNDFSIRDTYNHKDRIFICNYRFIKEFTKGITSDWTINVINHFNITHLEPERK